MKTFKILSFAAMLLMLVGGCASYETPRHDAHFGAPPSSYAQNVRTYFERHLHYPPEARIDMGKPRKGYMNEGLFTGGEILWVGYLVDVEVQSVDRGLRRSEHYVVRLRNDDVVDVHESANTPVLHDI